MVPVMEPRLPWPYAANANRSRHAIALDTAHREFYAIDTLISFCFTINTPSLFQSAVFAVEVGGLRPPIADPIGSKPALSNETGGKVHHQADARVNASC